MQKYVIKKNHDEEDMKHWAWTWSYHRALILTMPDETIGTISKLTSSSIDLMLCSKISLSVFWIPIKK